ncbi:MAG: TonB-dependent receptor [Bacteroidota bacterium]|nr:TonB-dependent receptor [Bacteroidota bacterium]
MNLNMRKYLVLLNLFFFFTLQAQYQVNGRVTMLPDNSPAIGAVVSVKGTTLGTVTDFDGKYSIDVPTEKSILVINYTGYATQEFEVGSRSTIDASLKETVSQLDEVIVTGYGVQKRSNISGSVATVSAEDIAEQPILRVEQALQGRTAGVNVAQVSGSPGSALTVRIRGVGTINNSDPLYIVDGMPVEGLDYLNPNDIESVNVLKDAASSAIYGSRGANGVVLITTKGGKRNQEGSVSYDAYYGVQRAARLLDLLNAREYATLQNEAYVAAGKTPLAEFANPDALGVGTDWQEAIFTDAPISSHQLTIAGGGEKSSFTLSGNYFSQDGIIGGDKANFQRATIRLNGNHDLKKWLTIGNNLGFTWFERDAIGENSQYNSPVVRALNMDPVTPIRKADGTYAYSNYADTDIANPVNAIDQTHNTWRSNRFVGGVYGEVKLGNKFSFRTTASMDITFALQRIFYPKFDLSSIPEISEAPAAEKSVTNSVNVGNNTWRNLQLENVLTYQNTFNELHELTLIGGTTALDNRYDGSGGANTNLPSNDPDDAYIGNTIDPIASQSAWQTANESSLLSYFGKANYAFDDRYLFSATFRADGSSRFGKNNRYGYFPSFSAGWIISHEDFWTSEKIDFVKLRASWGQNGNDRIGDYSFTTVVSSGQNYAFGPNETITNGSVALNAANPDLKWETSTQTDIGLDVELMEGRINFTTDYYIKKTTDMLYAAPIPLVGGTAAPIQNIATAENMGFEFALGYRNIDHALRYYFGGNIAFIKSEVTGLGVGGEPVFSGYVQAANTNAAKTDVGHPLASFFGYVTDGIFQTQDEVEAAAFQSNETAPGDIRFKDLDGNGVIDVNDQTYIGNPTPKITYGINGDVEWKGIELNIFLQGTSGNDIFNNTVRYDFIYVNRPASVLERWTGPGTSNDEPRVNLSDPNQNARVSDRFVEDGSYLRLKTIQLGYNLPKAWLQKVGFEKFKIYVSGHNMLTFTKYEGLDPEIGSVGGSLELGIDRGFYPQARTVMGGLSVTF